MFAEFNGEAMDPTGIGRKEVEFGESAPIEFTHRQLISAFYASVSAQLMSREIVLIDRQTGFRIDPVTAGFMAVLVNPEFPEGHNNFGRALFNAGDLNGAIREYQTALELRKNYPKAQYNLSLAMQQKFLRQSIASSP